eukprot:TRINITY_DN108848_c0_g1_i1.p2 TRINITY_DN108848_c0_g1~~TRINITY_DN108848_c0_g1_i1.p2  ORF type:complete len:128 (-),score=6.34 TRINITY_DN108848_c0_g1_i1:67-450(-)
MSYRFLLGENQTDFQLLVNLFVRFKKNSRSVALTTQLQNLAIVNKNKLLNKENITVFDFIDFLKLFFFTKIDQQLNQIFQFQNSFVFLNEALLEVFHSFPEAFSKKMFLKTNQDQSERLGQVETNFF